MIFLDRTHKVCKSVEDFDLKPDSQAEVQRNAIFPVTLVLEYRRTVMCYDEYQREGKFWALGMGAVNSVTGWRRTNLNSLN